MNIQEIMYKAFNLGQTYWQQSDSEYVSQHKKSDLTLQKFEELSLAVSIDIAQFESLQKALVESLVSLTDSYASVAIMHDVNPNLNPAYFAAKNLIKQIKGQ